MLPYLAAKDHRDGEDTEGSFGVGLVRYRRGSGPDRRPRGSLNDKGSGTRGNPFPVQNGN